MVALGLSASEGVEEADSPADAPMIAKSCKNCKYSASNAAEIPKKG
jgi:hypothetical protein